MATYENIIKEFRKQGLSERQHVAESEVKKALDSIAMNNTGASSFDYEVAH